MKTSYTIPEVAKVCNVSERLVYHWCDRGSLIVSRPSMTVSRDNLLLFMNSVGLSVEGILHDHREAALKELLFKNIGIIIDALNDAIPVLRGSGYEKKMEELLIEINKVV